MKLRLFAVAAALAVCLTAVKPALADTTIYSQPWNTDNGFTSDNDFQSYDDFTLTSSATINEVGWYGTFFNAPSAFNISFYDDNGGVPGTAIQAEGVGNGSPVDAGTLPNFSELFSYSASVSPLTLGPGTYWISIMSPASGPAGRWFWETGDNGDGFFYQSNNGGIQTGFDLAFTLSNAVATPPVPEPSGIVLLGTGLVGFAGLVRRKLIRA